VESHPLPITHRVWQGKATPYRWRNKNTIAWTRREKETEKGKKWEVKSKEAQPTNNPIHI
jgi:hypothetical protein